MSIQASRKVDSALFEKCWIETSPHVISPPDLGAPLLILLWREPVDNLRLNRCDDRGAAGAVALRQPIRPVITEADMHALVARQMLDPLAHGRGQPARAQLEPA